MNFVAFAAPHLIPDDSQDGSFVCLPCPAQEGDNFGTTSDLRTSQTKDVTPAIIEDDQEDINPVSERHLSEPISTSVSKQVSEGARYEQPAVTPFDEPIDEPIDELIDQREAIQEKQEKDIDLQAQLLMWHHRLGHLSFQKIRLLCMMNLLPRKLLNVTPPMCAGCLEGAMTKKPWRVKSNKNLGKLRKAEKPGQIVSVDQLESTTPGFIAQLKGNPTKFRYTGATVFVDHYSDMTYIHLMKRLTSAETVEAKKAFEAYARNRGVQIQHYQ